MILRPKHTKLVTEGCNLPTGQKTITSKFTWRLTIIIHQLNASHCTRILIGNLLLTSMREVSVLHTLKIFSFNLIILFYSFFKITLKITLKYCQNGYSGIKISKLQSHSTFITVQVTLIFWLPKAEF